VIIVVVLLAAYAAWHFWGPSSGGAAKPADATKAGKTTIIVPLGGTEQNGPHMALGKHNARVKLLAGRIAAALGNALVAPVLAYVPEGTAVPPTGHMRFPGTITIPDGVLESILESAGRGFNLHGFKDVVFIGDHGGYQTAMAKSAAAIPSTRVSFCSEM